MKTKIELDDYILEGFGTYDKMADELMVVVDAHIKQAVITVVKAIIDDTGVYFTKGVCELVEEDNMKVLMSYPKEGEDQEPGYESYHQDKE